VREQRHFEIQTTDHFDEDYKTLEVMIPGLRLDDVVRQTAIYRRCDESHCVKDPAFPFLIPILIPF